MGGRRKAKKKGHSNAIADEELSALEAIYGEDMTVDRDRHGFSIKVAPDMKQSQGAVPSAVLVFRMPPQYPSAAAELRMTEPVLLTVATHRAISKQLHSTAAASAQQDAVCCYDIIELCRSRLQDVELDETVEAPSLWHKMQQREEDQNDTMDGAECQQPASVVLPQSDLFDDGRHSLRTSMPPSLLGRPSRAMHHAPHQLLPTLPPTEDLAGVAAVAAATETTPAAAKKLPDAGLPACRSSSGGEVSVSLVRSVLGAVRQGFSTVSRVLLPAALQRALDGNEEELKSSAFPGSQGKETVDSQEAVNPSLTESDAGQLRRDLLTGHLLMLATGSALPHTALPAVAKSLQEQGLLPNWVLWALTQQPQLFKRAFSRFFAEEISAANVANSLNQAGLQSFWNPSLIGITNDRPPLLPRNTVSGATGTANTVAAASASRYLNDFQEVRRLGKGGFGAVLLATNRLDGRQYAVKRIEVEATSATAFNRLMREVATLSRLQHPHVVRYYQAWFEVDSNAQACAAASEDDSSGWGPSVATNTTTATAPGHRPGQITRSFSRMPAGSSSASMALPNRTHAAQLPPVLEASSPGSFMSASESSTTTISAEDKCSSSGGGSSSSSSSSSCSSNEGTASEANASGSSSGRGLWQRWEGQVGATRVPGHGSGKAATMFSSGDFSASSGHGIVGSVAGCAPDVLHPWEASLPPTPAPKQLLYIQMEFCPRTLRQVLDDGTLQQGGSMDNAAAWLVVRQVLSGLAHIHSQGIIHRDLNPSNIFYDGRGDIRLGDFGLAKFTATNDQDGVLPDDEETAGNAGLGVAASSEVSGVMGTSFYIAPEVEQGQVYTEKVDLFSLGITAYELWQPFTTGMERVLALRNLRMQGKPPAEFYSSNRQVAQLVEKLLSSKVEDRPTARDVLASDMLPPSVEDQALTDMLRSLPDNPDTRDRVVAAVFATSAGDMEGATLPVSTPDARQMLSREAVLAVLREVFSRHGAVSSSFAAVRPPMPSDDASKAWLLLAPSGARLALRHELRRPFVEHLARQAASCAAGSESVAIRRYEIEAVQRRERGSSFPTESLAADFDIVGTRSASPVESALPEAESILAVTEIMAAVPLAGHCEVRIGHAALVAQAIAFAALPGGRDERDAVVQALTSAATASLADPNARSKRWQAIRIELEGLGLTGPEIGRCRALVLQLPGEAAATSVGATLDHIRTRLLPPSTALTKTTPFTAALDHLQELAGHLNQWGILPGRLFIDLLVAPTTEHHRQSLWQLYLVTPAGIASLLATGGRYDALLEAVWRHVVPAVPAASSPGGVGTTINVNRLVAAACDAGNSMSSSVKGNSCLHTSQAQVLVCSRGGGKHLLRERMALTHQLWSAGLRAEFLPLEAPSIREQYEHARAANIPWMVTLESSSFSATDTVVVKALDRRDDDVIPRTEVARFLLDAIATSSSRRSGLPGSSLISLGMRHDLHRVSALSPADDATATSTLEPDSAGGDSTGQGLTWRQRRKKAAAGSRGLTMHPHTDDQKFRLNIRAKIAKRTTGHQVAICLELYIVNCQTRLTQEMCAGPDPTRTLQLLA